MSIIDDAMVVDVPAAAKGKVKAAKRKATGNDAVKPKRKRKGKEETTVVATVPVMPVPATTTDANAVAVDAVPDVKPIKAVQPKRKLSGGTIEASGRKAKQPKVAAEGTQAEAHEDGPHIEDDEAADFVFEREPDLNDADYIDMFDKKEELQHILERSDTYVGSKRLSPMDLWVVSREMMSYLDVQSEEVQAATKAARKDLLANVAAQNAAAAAASAGDETGVWKKVKVPSPAKEVVPLCKITEEQHTVTYALFKIIDEILTNAADMKYGEKSQAYPLTKLDFGFDRHTGIIYSQNDGKAIPVVMSKDGTTLIPTLVFSQLLAGSNGRDVGTRFKGGRNAMGAKLCALFSIWFKVEICDTNHGVYFEQTWSNNLKNTTGAKVTPFTEAERKKVAQLQEDRQRILAQDPTAARADQLEKLLRKAPVSDYVRVSFLPEYARFGDGAVTGLDDAHLRWIYRRTIDFAATLQGVQVRVNGKSLAPLVRNVRDKVAGVLLGEASQLGNAAGGKRKRKKGKRGAGEDDEDGDDLFGEDEDGEEEEEEEDDESEEDPEDEHMESDADDTRTFPSTTAPTHVPSARKQEMAVAERELAAEIKKGIICKRINAHWEVAFARSMTGRFQHMSICNNVVTSNGGTHVNAVTQQLVDRIVDRIMGNKRAKAKVAAENAAKAKQAVDAKKKGKGKGKAAAVTVTTASSDDDDVKPDGDTTSAAAAPKKKAKVKEVLSAEERKERTHLGNLVKNHLFVYVNCLVPDPEFDSQSKLKLDTPQSKFRVNVIDPVKQKLKEAGQLPSKQDEWVHNADGTIKTSGSLCDMDDDFLNAVIKKLRITEDVEQIRAVMEQKLLLTHNNKTGARTIVNADDYEKANWAGTRRRDQTTLCLTEGKSALAMILQAFSVVGRDKWGAYPMRGKGLNVLGAKLTRVLDNIEFNDIRIILGLEFGKKYTDDKELCARDKSWTHISALNYRHIMICADQDTDGFHIIMLLINFFNRFWPELLKVPGFLQMLVTPILKITHKRTKEVVSFFSQPSFEEWKTDKDMTQYSKPRYYKGLGTSSPLEAKQYFRNLTLHRRDFVWGGESCTDAIHMAFRTGPGSTQQRKNWINSAKWPDLAPGQPLTYESFVHNQLWEFARALLKRSIPSLIDGLKPVQRKILFSALKKRLIAEIKVASMAGMVQDSCQYHHGEKSLTDAIIKMAQDYLGSNNVNLLDPRGQFGDRAEGGQNAASARYISTCLTRVTRMLFHADDDQLLERLEDDGKRVEYKWFIPVIPYVLWQGAAAIAKGWSTFVPSYDINDLCDNIERMLEGQEPLQMTPSFRDNTGLIEPGAKPNQFITFGRIERIVGERVLPVEAGKPAPKGKGKVTKASKETATGKKTASLAAKATKEDSQVDEIAAAVAAGQVPGAVVITDPIVAPTGAVAPGVVPQVHRYLISELPIGTWTKPYKLFLEDAKTGIFSSRDAKSGKIKKQRVEAPRILDYSAHHIDNSVRFIIEMNDEQLAVAQAQGLYRHFQLYDSMSLNNLVLFDEHDKLNRYESSTEILKAFFPTRLRYYELRKQALARDLRVKAIRLGHEANFLELVDNGEFTILKRTHSQKVQQLRTLGFPTLAEIRTSVFAGIQDVTEDREDAAVDDGDDASTDIPDADATAGVAKEDASYDYLLNKTFRNLDANKIKALREQHALCQAELLKTEAEPVKFMWRRDMDRLRAEYREYEAQRALDLASASKDAGVDEDGGDGGDGKSKATKKKNKKRKRGEDEDEDKCTVDIALGLKLELQPQYLPAAVPKPKKPRVAKAAKATKTKEPRAPKAVKDPKTAPLRKRKADETAVADDTNKKPRTDE